MAHQVNEILTMSFENQFRIISHGLENAKLPEISEHISCFGFTHAKVDRGIALVETARRCTTRQQTQCGEQVSATEAFYQKMKSADKITGTTWKIAKVAVEDLGIRAILGINKPRKYTKGGWLSQMEHFYRNITVEVIELLSEYGYTAEKIEKERIIVEEAILADKRKDDKIGESQRATTERNNAVRELHVWIRKFYRISKIALADHPQLIEKLGIIDKR